MLLPAGWVCAPQEIPPREMARKSKQPYATHSGNFSHSEQAELCPEFVLCDMGPNGIWSLYASLDADGFAAAGRKLTLDMGLGREKLPAKKKDRDCSLPSQFKR